MVQARAGRALDAPSWRLLGTRACRKLRVLRSRGKEAPPWVRQIATPKSKAVLETYRLLLNEQDFQTERRAALVLPSREHSPCFVPTRGQPEAVFFPHCLYRLPEQGGNYEES